MPRTFIVILCSFGLIISATVSAAQEYWEYTFRPGDTVWEIAKTHTNSVNNWNEIYQLNSKHLGPDRQIPPGTRIIIPVSMLKLQPTPAKVIALSGDVQLIRANGTIEVIQMGTLLYSGDKVITEKQQNLRIQFADLSELQVLPESEIVLDKLSHHKKNGMVDTRVRLNFGSVDTSVEKQKKGSYYQIKTPAALTAVRGTAFRLSSDKSQISRVEVSEGLVGVSAGGVEKAVEEGFGIVAEKDKPLKDPVKLLLAPELSYEFLASETVIHVSWSNLDGAQYYRYQLAQDEKYNQIRIDTTTGDNIIRMDDLLAGQYFLRVRGVDENLLEGKDATLAFEIQPATDNNHLREVILPTGTLLLIQ